MDEIEEIKQLIAGAGLELMQGSFIKKNGEESRFTIRPVNSYKLLKLAMKAREHELANPT